MGNLRILLPDLMNSQAAIVACSSVASASTPAQNLATSEPWQIWRSDTNSPFDTMVYGYINGGKSMSVDAVAMSAMNMTPGNGEYRVVLTDQPLSFPAFVPFQEMVPTSVDGGSGAPGLVTDVNEGSGTPDGNHVTEDAVGSGAYKIFGFATPTLPPETGAKKQFFAVLVQATSGANFSQPYTPVDTSGSQAFKRTSITVHLYEDVAGTPTQRLEIGTKAVFGPDLHWLFFSWDAALLATADGSNVQIKIDFHGLDLGGSTQFHPDVESVYWGCDSGSFSGYSVVADSGWEAILPDAESGLGVDYSTQIGWPHSRLQVKFPAIESAKYACVMLREDHVPSESSPSNPPTVHNRYLLRQPPGYVQAGRLSVGLWWSPVNNRAQGSFATVTDPSEKFDDMGGGEWGSRSEPRVVLKIRMDWLTEQEAAWLHKRLLQEMGSLSPFYIELEPDATFEMGFGGWVTLLSVDNPIDRKNTDLYTYAMEFTVRVKR